VLRLAIVNSWPVDVIAGSGTATFFGAFVSGLQAAGYDVDLITPNFDTSNYVQATLRRFLFNTELRTDPHIQAADVVIGFDYDGYGLDPARRPTMITSALSVYGDVIRWESEPYRTIVEAQAFFDQVAMERADHITIGSQYAKARIVALYGIPPEKITVIPYGLPPGWLALADSEPRRANDHPVVLSVAKMYPRKRTDILLRAVAVLQPKYPALELRIVGDGLGGTMLMPQPDELGINANVTWLGHIRDEAAFAREWRQADVFCHASSRETFGFVYLEAMLTGKAIVAARPGGPGGAGRCGAARRAGEPEALAAGLAAMIDDPAKRRGTPPAPGSAAQPLPGSV
jgi:glycosyltransferase involved in cell wall biosynthesis